MQQVRDYYFRTLDRLTSVLTNFSDPPSADTFGRLERLLRLIDLRTAAGDPPSLDTQKSGLPILKEVVSVSNDLQQPPQIGRTLADIKSSMLDEMLARRRMPGRELIAEAAAAVYAAELRSGHATSFQPDAERSFDRSLVRSERGAGVWVRASWDYWDGAEGRAVRSYADFGGPGEVSDEVLLVEAQRAASIANRFSGAGFKPLTLADQIDAAMDSLRLKRLVRVTVGPFLSDVFYTSEDALMPMIRAADDLENAWAIRWSVDTLASAGTRMVGGGLFSSPRPQEVFDVNTADPDCAQRGVTEVAHHIAMPHAMYQRIAGRRDEHSTLRNAHYHVIAAGDRLIEYA
jgi:hypothetical protein